MVDHIGEHLSIALHWHQLICISEVAVVSVGSGGDSLQHISRKVLKIKTSPLFFCVVSKELFTEILSNLR